MSKQTHTGQVRLTGAECVRGVATAGYMGAVVLGGQYWAMALLAPFLVCLMVTAAYDKRGEEVIHG